MTGAGRYERVGTSWILGVIGALVGIALSDSGWLLGAVVGFFVLYFIGELSQLRRRLGKVERELTAVRTRCAAQVPPAVLSSHVDAKTPEPTASATRVESPDASRVSAPLVLVRSSEVAATAASVGTSGW